MQDPLETYVVNLLKEKGESDTPESRAELLNKINDYIDKALVGALPLEQFSELDNAAKENRVDDDMVEELLANANIDSEKVVSDALENFKNEYLKGENK